MPSRKKMTLKRVVEWPLRGRGSGITVSGKVVEIIPAGKIPSMSRATRGRAVESYVVKSGEKLYWPEPNRLTILE